MEEDLFETSWHKKTKWLTQALILSGALNLGLIATFVYFALTPQTVVTASEENQRHIKEKFSKTNAEILTQFFSCSFHELLGSLRNQTLIEEGYSVRDLALSCLVSFHYFDLERALSGYHLQKRAVQLVNPEGGEKIGMTLFPGLLDHHFQAISLFAQREKWPLTAEGIHSEMQMQKDAIAISLKDAFFLTSEFQSIFTLLNRLDMTREKQVALSLILESSWEIIGDISRKMRQGGGSSLELFREFLVKSLEHGSSVSARFLVEKDREFSLKYLTDVQLSCLAEKYSGEEKESFAKAMKQSVRSDLVLSKADSILQESAPQNLPEKPLPQKIIYTIQSGDTLWKISNKYKVTVSAIKLENQLYSEKLLPGKELTIPTALHQRRQDEKDGT
ncbi:MAG: LysM peptidoglycan-binding domain-containing protein [Simkaniaceae bacterium]|nr:LysM peptidoglycan-binding domain-containing protein [Simkaniaceae bacterium]